MAADIDQDVLESIKILSEDRKVEVLEQLGVKELQEIADSIDDRSYKFVHQTFGELESLNLVEKTDEQHGTGGTVDVERTKLGNSVLDLEKDYRNNFDRAVERFFDNEFEIDSPGIIHDLVEYNGGDMLELKSKGVPGQFLYRPRAVEMFYSVDPSKSISDYANEFDVSNNTVRTWIRGLKDEGLVVEELDGHSKSFYYGPFAFPMLKLEKNLSAAFNAIDSFESVGDSGEGGNQVEEKGPENEESRESYAANGRDSEGPAEPDWIRSAERKVEIREFRNMGSNVERAPSDQPWSQRFNQESDDGAAFADGGFDDYFEKIKGRKIEGLYDELESFDLDEGSSFEEAFNQEYGGSYGVHRVVTVNQDSVIMAGGYIWNRERDLEVEEGDSLIVEYGKEHGAGFDEVEPFYRIKDIGELEDILGPTPEET